MQELLQKVRVLTKWRRILCTVKELHVGENMGHICGSSSVEDLLLNLFVRYLLYCSSGSTVSTFVLFDLFQLLPLSGKQCSCEEVVGLCLHFLKIVREQCYISHAYHLRRITYFY